MINSIFNFLGDLVDNAINVILMLLPDSPFMMLTSIPEVTAVLGFLNWAIPIAEMIAILQLWVTAVSVFYIYQLILRWAKAIE